METKNLTGNSRNTQQNSFTYSFMSGLSPTDIFNSLLDVKKWWFGFYEETITGKSKMVNDEFSFKAGGGMHYTIQKLVELIPDKKIVWLVTKSELSFLDDPDEWRNTRIHFDISREGDKTRVTFTHEGLIPEFECYDNCSSAWTQYMQSLEERLA